jgi:hypothetical protein
MRSQFLRGRRSGASIVFRQATMLRELRDAALVEAHRGVSMPSPCTKTEHIWSTTISQ